MQPPDFLNQQLNITDFKRIVAPSSSADKFTKHKSESFDTVGSLSSASSARAVIISSHLHRSCLPSSEPVKPIENNFNKDSIVFFYKKILNVLLRKFVTAMDFKCCGVSGHKNC